jgi:predicted NUDIX family phosphoesterase
MTTTIAVLPRQAMDSALPQPGGFRRETEFWRHRWTLRLQPMDRALAEADVTVKQPIAYAVVRRGDQWLVMERLQGGAEARLHGSWTLGVGGHVDHPWNQADPVWQAMLREWEEEVQCSAPPRWRWLGVVNDDGVAVGVHHVGFVWRVDLPADAEVTMREPHKLACHWRRVDEILPHLDRLESWSRFVLEALMTEEGP